MTQKMMETRQLKVDTVHLMDDADNTIKRDLILEYSNSFPEKLYLQLLSSDPNIEGWMNSFDIEEVEKLRRYLTQVYNLMKEVPNDENS